MSQTVVNCILHRIPAMGSLVVHSKHCCRIPLILRHPHLQHCVHRASRSPSLLSENFTVTWKSAEWAFRSRTAFSWAVLGGLLLGSAAAIRAYCVASPVHAAWITRPPPEPQLCISQSRDRAVAQVTFDLPEHKHFQRIFLRLNHCVTDGGDAADIFINNKPLRLHCRDVPVFDYEEQEVWIPHDLCHPGHNVVRISLGEGHKGQYWLLDACVDAYEEGPVLIFRMRTTPGGKAPALAGRLIM